MSAPVIEDEEQVDRSGAADDAVTGDLPSEKEKSAGRLAHTVAHDSAAEETADLHPD